MAGRGQRFVDKGYVNPKPLIIAGGKHIIDYSFDSIEAGEYNLIFVVRKDHVHAFAIDDVLRKKYGSDIKIVVADDITGGSVCSCLLAKEFIDNDAPLYIYTLDVGFEPTFRVSDVPNNADGFILTFKANSPAYSYAELDVKGEVTRTAEKQVISQFAAAGIYYFKRGDMFVEYAEAMIKANDRTNGEFYICPLYNRLISDGRKVVTKEVDKMHIMGTPEELDFFVKKTLPDFGEKPVAICCDHSGFDIKNEATKLLELLDVPYIDFGTYSPKDCDYNDFVRQAAKHIKEGICDFGLGFCRSGQGVNIAANKLRDIRSALVYDEYTAEYARRHNCANFFSIPSRGMDRQTLKNILTKLKYSSFDGGRHMTRVIKAESNANI